jgi:hypothetical protein
MTQWTHVFAAAAWLVCAGIMAHQRADKGWIQFAVLMSTLWMVTA